MDSGLLVVGGVFVTVAAVMFGMLAVASVAGVGESVDGMRIPSQIERRKQIKWKRGSRASARDPIPAALLSLSE